MVLQSKISMDFFRINRTHCDSRKEKKGNNYILPLNALLLSCFTVIRETIEVKMAKHLNLDQLVALFRNEPNIEFSDNNNVVLINDATHSTKNITTLANNDE